MKIDMFETKSLDFRLLGLISCGKIVDKMIKKISISGVSARLPLHDRWENCTSSLSERNRKCRAEATIFP
uniref:Uncharacterized protein n=1 Tax=Candidatus Kentrum sp. SD TaxID=2126332 RepID=A0A450Z6F6_9GAMM|nr:MAG: hypothetical protein BECKSD772F_GA0070984_11743 [Candidatus Kentron sp. SD]VFK49400.1 MAG: hypothetical protein BECKSD772E_GA0070983_11763 [Candidatus Kentron sp. SD]